MTRLVSTLLLVAAAAAAALAANLALLRYGTASSFPGAVAVVRRSPLQSIETGNPYALTVVMR